MTACACDKSPTSARTTARSVLPDEKAFAASPALDVSITFSRTLAFVAATRDAMAETIRPASPSSEPTATPQCGGTVIPMVREKTRCRDQNQRARDNGNPNPSSGYNGIHSALSGTI